MKKKLKKDEIIQLGTDTYSVYSSSNSGNSFLVNRNGSHSNGYIFEELGLDKEEFTRSVIGYFNEGEFPFCETFSDLEKLVSALREKLPNMNVVTITREQFRQGYELACLSWKEKLMEKFSKELALHDTIEVPIEYLEMLYDAASLYSQRRFIIDLGYKDDTISCSELEIGEAMILKSGRVIVRTYSAFVDVMDMRNTWDLNTAFIGKRVKLEIKVID